MSSHPIFQQGDDVLVHILLFCPVDDILKIATVSRSWSWASNRRELWDALCKRRKWPVQSGLSSNKGAKRFYVQKLLRNHMYANSQETKDENDANLANGSVFLKKEFAGNSGLMSFYAVPERSFYSWEQGKCIIEWIKLSSFELY
jgi:hypothetical protein